MSTKRAIELTERIDSTLVTLIFLIGALEEEIAKTVALEVPEAAVTLDVLTETGEDG
jgi:hypothetical protein